MGSMGAGGQGSAEAVPGDVPPTSAEPAAESQQKGRVAEAARTVMWAAKEGAGEAAAKAEGAKAAASQAGQTVADRAASAAQSTKASAAEAGQAAAGKAAAAGQAAKEGAQQAAAKVQGTAAGEVAGAAAGCVQYFHPGDCACSASRNFCTATAQACILPLSVAGQAAVERTSEYASKVRTWAGMRHTLVCGLSREHDSMS